MWARLVNGLEPHPPPLSSQKNEILLFWIALNFWWLAGLVDGLKPHPPSLSSQKNEMLIFGLHSTLDDWPGWSMDSNPIHLPSAANKMKSSFLYYVQLLMISLAGWWTQTPSANPLQPKKWNAHFWILFNFWWSGRLVNGLKPHLPPLSSQKKWNAHFSITINFWLRPDWSVDSNPIHHPSPTNKWNACFWITLNFWWLAGLVDGLKPHPPPLFSPKNEILIFGLCSTSDDQPGWSMDSNPICQPSPAKKVKCSFFYYNQLLI